MASNRENFCHCGRLAILKTSWTDDNPGRRFFGYTKKRSGCGFFRWEDPPMCARAKVIIPGLLRKLNRMEDKIAQMQRRQTVLVYFLVVSWLMVLF